MVNEKYAWLAMHEGEWEWVGKYTQLVAVSDELILWSPMPWKLKQMTGPQVYHRNFCDIYARSDGPYWFVWLYHKSRLATLYFFQKRLCLSSRFLRMYTYYPEGQIITIPLLAGHFWQYATSSKLRILARIKRGGFSTPFTISMFFRMTLGGLIGIDGRVK